MHIKKFEIDVRANPADRHMFVERSAPMSANDRYATASEVRRAITGLQDVDYARLMLIARYFHRTRVPGAGTTPEDLLQTAITKTLDGKRKWSKAVPISKHLDRAMESESGHLLEKRQRQVTLPLAAAAGEADTGTPAPDTAVCIADDLEQVLRLFEGDRLALDVLRLKAEGLSASAIRSSLKLTETQYDTVTQGIRRVIIKYLSQGGNSP